MSKLKELLNQITVFGIHPRVELSNKEQVLKKLLVGIYWEYLQVEVDLQERQHKKKPNFHTEDLLKNVQSNFPNFGWYSFVLNSNHMEPEVVLGIGDELDDLADIIRDLLEVKWRLDNTSKNDALWHFEFFMRTHAEQHLVDLLKRLKERND